MVEPYQPRELARPVSEALESMPVVVVTGLRQAGKTTFLRRDPIFAGRRYLTLDDLATLAVARSSPEALVEDAEALTIDEAQRCPELLLAIKREVDRRRAPGRFVLSGSANLALLGGVSESLAGRALYFTLHPFSRRERLGIIEPAPFLVRSLEQGKVGGEQLVDVERLGDEEILDGGLPPIVLEESANRELWLRGYEQTYLERDVRDLSQVADLVTFRNFVRLAALRTAQVLNQSDLARDAKLSVSTTIRYLGLLETSFLAGRLPPYLRSRSSRLIKSPKLFFTDSALAAHLCGITDLAPGTDEPLRGALYETFVYQNLLGILESHLPRAEISFWSVQGRHEVDFVVATPRRAVAVEVKAAGRFGERDLAGLKAFLAKTPEAVAGLLAYNGTELLPLGERLWAVPLRMLLA